MPELLDKHTWSVLQDVTYEQRILLDAEVA